MTKEKSFLRDVLSTTIRDNMITVRKIHNLLLHHPVYNWMKEDSDTIEILVVGEGEFAETFVDETMEIVQGLGKELIITWCSDKEDVKENYLSMRPALHEFINIDGELNNSGLEVYGLLNFAKLDTYLSDEYASAVYAFISTGDDAQNKETAELIKEAISNDCLCAYVTDDEIDVYAIDSREKEEDDDIYSLIASDDELMRMAFNAHFVWEGTGNIDIEKAKKRFYDDEYNMSASCDFILSIPYKLANIGIEYTCLEDAIKQLTDSSKYREHMSALAYLEHRRWVIDLLTSGFSPMRPVNGNMNYTDCVVRRSVKDKVNKIHPCLVRSTSEAPLLDSNNINNRAVWDKISPVDVKLDELDKMSVDLHRVMLREAKKLKKEGSQERTDLFDKLQIIKASIPAAAPGSTYTDDVKKLKKNYDRYEFCIKNIVDKSLPHAVQFETYEKDLISCITDQTVFDAVNDVRSILFPALEAYLYRDYKKYDIELCEKLPFILSNKFDSTLGIVFNIVNRTSDTNHEMFKNVASATALYAKTINYLFRVTKDTNLDVFSSKVERLRNYFEYRGFSAEINFSVFLTDANEKKKNATEKVLKSLKGRKFIDDYSIYDGTFEEIVEYAGNLVSECDYYDGTNLFSKSSFESLIFTERIINTGVSYFEFDSDSGRFENCIHADNLKYLSVTSFIQVEDMFALMRAEDKEFNYQDYADTYMDYWKVYCGDDLSIPGITDANKKLALCATCWTQLCEILKHPTVVNRDISTANAGICGFSRQQQLKVIKQMLNVLKNKGIIKTLTIDNTANKVTATLASAKCRAMFSKAGDVLETYVYFEACKMSWFDDIQTGYKFKWERGEVDNELDAVLTKGYKTILLECKSVVSPDENFYLKLDSLANRFGINCRKVMVLVTDMNPDNDDRKKARNRLKSRGNQLGIVTISSKRELDNIGKKLQEML